MHSWPTLYRQAQPKESLNKVENVAMGWSDNKNVYDMVQLMWMIEGGLNMFLNIRQRY